MHFLKVGFRAVKSGNATEKPELPKDVLLYLKSKVLHNVLGIHRKMIKEFEGTLVYWP
jgi:hypothetical protein